MSLRQWLTTPLSLVQLLGTEKSFRKNRVLGSPDLNERGLHRRRVSIAYAMAGRRRAALASTISDDVRSAFDRDGFVALPDYLPAATFDTLVAKLRATPLPAREMRQGPTVTRMISLGPAVLKHHADLAAIVGDRGIRQIIRYAAASGGVPVWSIQTVIAKPGSARDPQSDLHADTFHPTAKAWLFLQDVGEDDGPFMYVPGSHRLTPRRLDWEYRTSLTARDDPRAHHANGSFRVRPEELDEMGFPQPRKITAKANTLVVADTFGFHARSPSPRPTLRMELHAHLRHNPFWPSTMPGITALPGIAERQLDIYFALGDFRARRGKAPLIWKPVGDVTADAPARI